MNSATSNSSNNSSSSSSISGSGSPRANNRMTDTDTLITRAPPTTTTIKLNASDADIICDTLRGKSPKRQKIGATKLERAQLAGSRERDVKLMNQLARLTYILGVIEVPQSEAQDESASVTMGKQLSLVQSRTADEDFLRSTVSESDHGKFMLALCSVLEMDNVKFRDTFHGIEAHNWNKFLHLPMIVFDNERAKIVNADNNFIVQRAANSYEVLLEKVYIDPDLIEPISGANSVSL